MSHRVAVLVAGVAMITMNAFATTFVVPKDRDMVALANMVVVGTAETSYTRLNAAGGIETVTELKADEVLKGRRLAKNAKILVVEPGGKHGDQILSIPSVPRFRDGERVLLMLSPAKKSGEWAVTNLALGKFTLAVDSRGREVALRNEHDVNGWTIDGNKHVEQRRDAAGFRTFIQSVAAGQDADDDGYFLPAEAHEDSTPSGPVANSHSSFAATTYLLTGNIRWNAWPQTYVHGNTVAGAPNGGVDAILSALGLWNNDAQSNVNFVHGGLDGTKTGGIIGAADGANSILWERDLSSWGAGPYTCASGGVLGIGGVRGFTGQGSHTGPDGETFGTATEGDVEMNQGIANCSNLFNSTVFVLGLTHEVGHTMGFRHADQNPDFSTPCSGRECVPVPPVFPNPDPGPHAVMRSSIANGLPLSLQSYDQNAVRAVYPNSVVSPPPAPTGLTATATSSTTVTVSWAAATGATSYKVFRRTSIGGTYETVATGVLTTSHNHAASPNTAYQYVVRATNDGGDSGDSNSDFTTAIAFTDTIGSSLTVKLLHFTELQTGVNALRTLAGLSAFSFSAPTPAIGTAVSKVHLDGLRTALNAARTALGGSAISFAETITAGTTTAKGSHITEIRNGVF